MLAERRARNPAVEAWLLAALLAGCGGGDPALAGANRGGEATPTGATIATDQVLLDLRLPATRFQASAAESRQVVAAVYGDGAPAGLELTSRIEGAFTAPGSRQIAYLLRREGAVPGAARAPALLAVLDSDGGVAAQFVVEHDRIAGAEDIEGDGVDALFLTTDGYHMGQAYTGLELVSLAGAQRRSLATWPEARLDSCANPVGARHLEAAVVVRGERGVELLRFRAACSDAGPPGLDDYRQIPAPPASS